MKKGHKHHKHLSSANIIKDLGCSFQILCYRNPFICLLAHRHCKFRNCCKLRDHIPQGTAATLTRHRQPDFRRQQFATALLFQLHSRSLVAKEQTIASRGQHYCIPHANTFTLTHRSRPECHRMQTQVLHLSRNYTHAFSSLPILPSSQTETNTASPVLLHKCSLVSSGWTVATSRTYYCIPHCKKWRS